MEFFLQPVDLAAPDFSIGNKLVIYADSTAAKSANMNRNIFAVYQRLHARICKDQVGHFMWRGPEMSLFEFFGVSDMPAVMQFMQFRCGAYMKIAAQHSCISKQRQKVGAKYLNQR